MFWEVRLTISISGLETVCEELVYNTIISIVCVPVCVCV